VDQINGYLLIYTLFYPDGARGSYWVHGWFHALGGWSLALRARKRRAGRVLCLLLLLILLLLLLLRGW